MSRTDSNEKGSDTGASVEAPPRPELRLWRVWLLATIAAALLYGLTLAPGVAWGDSADAQVRVHLGQWVDRKDLVRSHMPFYIVATALAKPGLTPALAANLVAAAAGALTVGNVVWLIALLTRRRIAIFTGTCLLMLSHALWHVSTVAEVMTFSTMLLTFELVFLLYFIKQSRFRWLLAALLANGFGLATHNMAVLTWPAYIAVLLYMRNAIPSPRGPSLLVAFLALLAGASPLADVFLTGMKANPDASAVIHDMLIARYGSFVFNTSLPSTVVRAVAYICYSFPSPLLFLLPIGLVALWRTSARPTAVLFTLAFAAHFLFAVRYNVPDQHMFMLHSLVLGAVLIGFAVDRITAARPSAKLATVLALISLTGPVVYAVLPNVLRRYPRDLVGLPSRKLPHRDAYRWFLQPWRHGYTGPQKFAQETLEALPPEAVLAVDSTPMPTLVYLQAVSGFRRDVRIPGAERFQNWLEPLDPTSPELVEAIGAGRVFTITDDQKQLPPALRDPKYEFIRLGPVFQVVFANDTTKPFPDQAPAGQAASDANLTAARWLSFVSPIYLPPGGVPCAFS